MFITKNNVNVAYSSSRVLAIAITCPVGQYMIIGAHATFPGSSFLAPRLWWPQFCDIVANLKECYHQASFLLLIDANARAPTLTPSLSGLVGTCTHSVLSATTPFFKEFIEKHCFMLPSTFYEKVKPTCSVNTYSWSESHDMIAIDHIMIDDSITAIDGTYYAAFHMFFECHATVPPKVGPKVGPKVPP